MNDQEFEGTFRWVDGHYVNFNDDSLWWPSRPLTGDNSYDCCYAYFRVSEINTYVFLAYDFTCSNAYQSICEKRV